MPRKTFWQLPKKAHKFTKAVVNLKPYINRTKYYLLSCRLTSITLFQCWANGAWQNVQKTEGLSYIFKILEFPKGRKDKVLDARGRNSAAEMLLH